jgi:hypothetical protein
MAGALLGYIMPDYRMTVRLSGSGSELFTQGLSNKDGQTLSI